MHLISQAKIPVAKVIWRPGHGGFAFTVVCKATFELLPDVSQLSNQQESVTETDEWTDTGSLLRSTDLLPFKKRPEVLLMGDAHAPKGQPVSSLVARLVMGEIDKSIQVVGDRYARADGRVGEPAVFTRMPLVWERAAGGQGTENPVGRIVDTTPRKASNWTLAPNLYAPGFEGLRPGVPVAPVGFAPISPLWPSRLGCLKQHAVGWDPLRWYEHPLPSDIDFAYLNAAPVDQQRASPFADEVLYLENLHPVFARLSTRLPVATPVVMVDQGAGPEPLKLRCDTLVIDSNRGLAMLVWRGHVLMDHPDRAGRVVVTGPELSMGAGSFPIDEEANTTAMLVPARPRPLTVVLPPGKVATPPAFPPPFSSHVAKEAVAHSGANEFTDTIAPMPGAAFRAASVLPFAGASTEQAPAPLSSQVVKEAVAHSGANEFTDTIAPMPGAAFRAASVLPFAGASNEQPLARVEPPQYSPQIGHPPIEAPVPVAVLGVWPQLAPDKPVGQSSAVVPAPVQETVQETKRPAEAEPDAIEIRLRTIQRAIWKGDRPIQEILEEHGMTELEWRAAKRASSRKSNA